MLYIRLKTKLLLTALILMDKTLHLKVSTVITTLVFAKVKDIALDFACKYSGYIYIGRYG